MPDSDLQGEVKSTTQSLSKHGSPLLYVLAWQVTHPEAVLTPVRRAYFPAWQATHVVATLAPVPVDWSRQVEA